MAGASSSCYDLKDADDQLLIYILYGKLIGKPLPNGATIQEFDLYGEKNPWEIWEAFKGTDSSNGRDLYFFTKLKMKCQSGTRVAGTIGLGSWEGEDIPKAIMSKGTDQRVTGTKKRYRFEKSLTNQDGKWILHEYRLHPSLWNDQSSGNYALCRLRKNEKGIQKKEKNEKGSMRKIGNKSEGQEETRKRTIVLGMAATIAKNHVWSENEKKEQDVQGTTGRKRKGQLIQVPETTTTTHSPLQSNYSRELDDDDLNMSWPELFAAELMNFNPQVQEEDIPMFPNTFYRYLLGL